MKNFVIKIRHTLEMIKFSHSVFALPFALASLFYAAQGMPPLKILGLIVLCMVFARNTAMAFNRVVDAEIDKRNPRTATRHIPQGILSRSFVMAFIIINALLFMGTTYFINPLSFYLSPVALFIVCFYSLTKRFTHLTQLFLGLALGIAPIGAWIALRGELNGFPILLGLAVMFWVAGFDIIYATQDYNFDLSSRLKSLVVKWGIGGALNLARLFHLITLLLLASMAYVYDMQAPYWITVGLVASGLVYEHSLVKPNDLSRVNAAFFNVNGAIGVVFFLGMLLEVFKPF